MIALSRTSSRLARISSLMDLERDALRNGALDRLDGLVSERERLVDALNGTIESGDTESIAALQAIKAKAQRNAGLMGAALQGLQAASKELSEIDAARKQLSTYSSDGTVADVLAGEGRMEKRA